jgi:hypothetical protein
MKFATAAATIALLVAAIIIVLLVTRSRTPPTDIPFAPATSPAVDFARLEHDLPLSTRHLETLTPPQLRELTQEQIDQLYGRVVAGSIPDGSYDGDLFFPRGSEGDSRLAEIVGTRLTKRLGNLAVRQTEFFMRTLWKGKVFSGRERVVRNRIEDLVLLAPLLNGDTRDIEKTTVGGHDAYLLFPARMYCGQSLLDGRRESIVLDYLFSDELRGYRSNPDALAGRDGLRIRDEMRMIRPGFYLGRAYLDRVFVLNFSLFSAEAASSGLAEFRAGQTQQDCWTGTQKRAVR